MQNQQTPEELIREWEEKYFSLVWYARSAPAGDPSWSTTPTGIRTKALNEQARVEEMYPDEVDALKSESGDWTHGFNSGMLACLRLVMTAQNRQLITDPDASDDGEPFWIGGVEEAIAEFPFLDT
jgi:hypothetical protein